MLIHRPGNDRSREVAEATAGAVTDSPRMVWDLPTRVFHWTLALSIAGSWATAELDDWMQVHLYLGYLTLTLLLFRVAWGIVGTRHARFRGFVRGPGAVRRYVAGLRAGTAPGYAGHNPLGALSILAMLVALFVQVGLGLFSSDDVFYAGPFNGLLTGPQSDAVSNLHEANFFVVAGLAAFHVAVVLWYRFARRDDLIMPMITGRKPADRVPESEAIRSSRLGLAAVIVVTVALAVWALVALAPPPADPYGF